MLLVPRWGVHPGCPQLSGVVHDKNYSLVTTFKNIFVAEPPHKWMSPVETFQPSLIFKNKAWNKWQPVYLDVRINVRLGERKRQGLICPEHQCWRKKSFPTFMSAVLHQLLLLWPLVSRLKDPLERWPIPSQPTMALEPRLQSLITRLTLIR